jgi:hypothetical protein
MGPFVKWGPTKIPVTVCTPTIPPRGELLGRAMASVMAQTYKPLVHLILSDFEKIGAPKMLDLCLRTAQTEWVAILADDDEFLPHHLETLWHLMEENKADVGYTHFRYSNREDAGHLEKYRGLPFDHEKPRQMTGVYMGRREYLLDIGGHSALFDEESNNLDEEGNRIGEDFHLVKRLAYERAKVAVSPEVTWVYHVGHGNTLGMPSRW